MNMPKKIVVDCSTGISAEIELTEEEVDQLKADAIKAEADRKKQEEQAALVAQKKAELLEKLGITEEEAKLRLS